MALGGGGHEVTGLRDVVVGIDIVDISADKFHIYEPFQLLLDRLARR